MERRRFLERAVAGAIVGIGGAGAIARACAGEEEGDLEAGERASTRPGSIRLADRVSGHGFRTSCAAYSFRRELSGDSPSLALEDFIDLCAKWGLDGTELTSYYFRETEPAYLSTLRRRATVNGLTVSGVPIRSDFCVRTEEETARELDHVRAWIDRASLLGAQTIRIFGGSVPRGDAKEAAVARAIANMRTAADYAGTKGVVLALENHGGITETADGLIELVKGVGSPWLGVNLDTGNFHRDVYASLERAAPYAVAVQVKSEVREQGKGRERADYERFAGILAAAGYRGFVALEFEAEGDPMVEVPKELDRLRKALESV